MNSSVPPKSRQKDLHNFHGRPLKINKWIFRLINFIDNLGYFIFHRFIALDKFESTPKKILLSKNDHLGDVILFLKYLPSLRAHFRNSKIHLLVGSWSKPLVQNNPYIDRIIEYDDIYLIRGNSFYYKISRYIFTFIRTLIILWKEKYDLGVDFRGYFGNSILLLTLGRIKFRVGFSCGGLGFLLHKEVEWINGVHNSQHYLNILKSLGLENATRDDNYEYLIDKKTAAAVLEENNIGETSEFVIFHPRAGIKAKYWSVEGWRIISDYFLKKNMQIICTGSKNEAPYINEIVKYSHGKIINLAGRTSLRTLAGIIYKAKIVVALDSFTAHLSAALSKPVVVISSGISDIKQWKPMGKSKVQVVKKDIICSPCYIREGCKTMDCMEIDAASVLNDIAIIISETGK